MEINLGKQKAPECCHCSETILPDVRISCGNENYENPGQNVVSDENNDLEAPDEECCHCSETLPDIRISCCNESYENPNQNVVLDENNDLEVNTATTPTINDTSNYSISLSAYGSEFSTTNANESETLSSLFVIPSAHNGPNVSEAHFSSDCFVNLDEVKCDSYFFPVLKILQIKLEVTSSENFIETFSIANIGRNITEVLENIQAPQIESFEFIDRLHQGDKEPSNILRCFNCKKKNTNYWEKPLVNFVMRHCDSLKRLTIVTWKSSVNPEMQIGQKYVFPELEDLSVSFWGYVTRDCLTQRNNFWVALLLSQTKQLQNLKWSVSCSMSWMENVVPVIKNNTETLKSIQMPLPIISKDTQFQRKFLESNYIFSIDCAIFYNVTNLISLTLAWQYCFLKNVKYLPESLQEVHLFSIPVISRELLHFKNFRNLRHLSLFIPQFCLKQYEAIVNILRKEEYGVNLQVLKSLMESRSLRTINANIMNNCESLRNCSHVQTRGLRQYGEDFKKSGCFYNIRNLFRDMDNDAIADDDECSIYLSEFLETIQKINSDTGQISQDYIENSQHHLFKMYVEDSARDYLTVSI